MKFLLDSHVLLWAIEGRKLKREAHDIIASDALKFISAASIWELNIKAAKGKLKLPEQFKEVVDRQPLAELPVTSDHAHAVADLPRIHNDPFDRMLIAQALLEGLTIVTRDPIFRRYGVKVLEA